MSDDATTMLREQVSGELLNMTLGDFFELLDEYELNGVAHYDRMCVILNEVVDVLVEERSE
jgi:hypothetical protein